MAESPEFNPSDYPRTYTYFKEDRNTVTGICLALWVLAIGTYFFFPCFFPGPGEEAGKVTLSFLLAMLGCVFLIFPWTARLTFGPDYIEKRVLYIFSRRLKRNELAGYEENRFSEFPHWFKALDRLKSPRWISPDHIAVVPLDSYESRITFGAFETDTYCQRWCASLPDYEATRRNAMKRLSSPDRAGMLLRPGIFIGFLYVVIFLWPSFWMPSLSKGALAILLFIPFLCVFLALAKPERFSFFDPSYRTFLFNDSRPRIDLGPIYKTILISLSMWFVKYEIQGLSIALDSMFLDPATVTIFLVLLAGLLVPFYKNRRYSSSISALSLLFFSLVFVPIETIGITAVLNTRFDSSSPTISAPQVIVRKNEIEHDKATIDITRVKNLKRSLSSSKSATFSVKSDLYRKIKKGDILCFYNYTGLFYIKWSRLDFCPKTSADKLDVKKIIPERKWNETPHRNQ
jgi:hypothetical protein